PHQPCWVGPPNAADGFTTAALAARESMGADVAIAAVRAAMNRNFVMCFMGVIPAGRSDFERENLDARDDGGCDAEAGCGRGDADRAARVVEQLRPGFGAGATDIGVQRSGDDRER